MNTSASTARTVRFWLVALFLLGCFVQVYLAGRGAFGAGSYEAHKNAGQWLHLLSFVVLVVTFFGADMRNRVDIGLAATLFILATIQMLLGGAGNKDLAAFHPVTALLLIGAAAGIASRDRRLGSAGAPPRDAAPAA